jgi:DNA-binding NarL/FixJ family response regulator
MEAAMQKVKWNPARIRRMYKAGKNVSQIAKAIGYEPNTGNNRVRNFLAKAGLYKSSK